jgi:hypothetical protein
MATYSYGYEWRQIPQYEPDPKNGMQFLQTGYC